jgi:2-polyprenyl-3-methyl-5-hydroxy-6-metoxy-1,4-benzoquinol methylase
MSEEPRNPLAERLFRSALATFDLLTVYLGEQLGLYGALFEAGPSTSAELAERTGTFERYVREWLEQQAAIGLLTVDDASAEPTARRYRMPPEHAEVLVDRDSVNYEAHKGVDLVRAARPLPALVQAFRTGEALPPQPWEPDGRAEFNRARFLNMLGTRWLPAIPSVHERLSSGPPARVADLGCGTGWSSISMARAYPDIEVDGFDLDPDVIRAAEANASEAGLTDRVRFSVADAAGLGGGQAYDVVTMFEALHDMARPVEVLGMARALLAPGGSMVVADEKVGDAFAIPAPERERYAYGWSVVSCLPAAMQPGTAGTGAVMRPATLRRYAQEAGFSEVETLSVEDVEWRFYRLVP